MNIEAEGISTEYTIDKSAPIRANRYKEALKKYARLGVIGGVVAFSPIHDQGPIRGNETFQEHASRARSEMRDNGITMEQRDTYIQLVNDFFYKGIYPSGYSAYGYDPKIGESTIPLSKIKDLIYYSTKYKKFIGDSKEEIQREDAWRLYLGLSQISNTFGISEYQPTRSKDQEYYYKINNFWADESRMHHKGNGKKMVSNSIDEINLKKDN